MSQSDFVTRGQTLVASGQFQEAVKVCRLGLLGRPTTVEGRVVLGQALLALKRYDEVLAEMRVALELDHSSIAAQLLKGEALLRKGDPHGAVDVLGKLRPQAPTDPRVEQLLAEAAAAVGRPASSAVHPSVSFVGNTSESTKHYVNHATGDGEEDTGGSYTRPTSVSTPGLKKKSRPVDAAPFGPHESAAATGERTPPPQVLAVGDERTGTVEVDPDLDGIELRPSEDDMGGPIGPPPSRNLAAVSDPNARGGVPSTRSMGAVGAPNGPRSRPQPPPEPKRTQAMGSGGARSSQEMAAAIAANRPRPKGAKQDISTVELEDDEDLDSVDLVEVETPPPETVLGKRPPPSARVPIGTTPGTPSSVRSAVRVPPGPMSSDQTASSTSGMRSVSGAMSSPPVSPAANRPTQAQPVPPPPHLAQMIANQPHVMQMSPVPQQPPRSSAVAAAMPTMAAQPMPPPYAQQPPPQYPVAGNAGRTQQGMMPPPVSPAANMPTMAMAPAPAQPQPFSPQEPFDAVWGRSGAPPPQQQPPPQPMPMPMPMPPASPPPAPPPPADSQLSAILNDSGASSFVVEPSASNAKAVRKKRSKFTIVMWFVIGAAVIGGGIFAGLQIRAMRLASQIESTRDEAVDLAALDTYKGWAGARDRQAGIVNVSGSVENRATLARTRAVVAFEFQDGLAEAKNAVSNLSGQGGLDGEIAAAYVALASNDAKAAREAADAALKTSATDAAAQYVAGRATLLGGDAKAALTLLEAAHKADARPLYAVAVAEAHAARGAWDDALKWIATANADAKAAREKKDAKDQADGKEVRTGKDDPDEHPSAVIARAMVLAQAGRISPTGKETAEVRTQLQKVIAEGTPVTKSLAEQPRGISPAQVAFANLALAQLEFQRNDPQAAAAAFRAALAVNYDEQRFAEQAIETLYAIGELKAAMAAADRALTDWPTSRRARIGKAQILLATGKAGEAADLLDKAKDLQKVPRAIAVRAQIDVALGKPDGARVRFKEALDGQPNLEIAVVGRAWLHLDAGEAADAKALVEKLYKANARSLAVITAYAAALARTGDRENAQQMLKKAVEGAGGLDVGRAHLELARISRDMGDERTARTAYEKAIASGIFEARIESALMLIENGDPTGGRDSFEALLKTIDKPTPALLLEAARARMLFGDDANAEKLLGEVDKVLDKSDRLRWKLDRERGRLAMRKVDYAGAAGYFRSALDGSGDDAETLLLAADTAAADEKKTGDLGAKVKKLGEERLGKRPEALIVSAKLIALTPAKGDDAQNLFQTAAKQLESEKASARRRAQARLGLGVVAYIKEDDPTAELELEVAIGYDPSLYAAYIYAAEIAKDLKKAVDLAQLAVKYNPRIPEAWYVLGSLASRGKNKKLLEEAVTRLNELTPGSELVTQLLVLQRQ